MTLTKGLFINDVTSRKKNLQTCVSSLMHDPQDVSSTYLELSRFGVVESLEYEAGHNFAIITFVTVESAEAAVQAMRGFPLGGSDYRIRVRGHS